MAGVNITPGTVGGRFTNVMPYVIPPVLTAQDGGRIMKGAFTGGGASIAANSQFTDDTSATWPQANSNSGVLFTEGVKHDIWGSVPFTLVEDNFQLGSSETGCGTTNYFVNDGTFPSNASFPGTMAYFDNAFNGGEAGIDNSWFRTGRNFGAVSNNPAPTVTDTGSVKTYIANQYNFTTPTPVSDFTSIMSYAACSNPLLPASSYPLVDYEAAWDIFGTAHFNTAGITLEIMFWTRNHNQHPDIGVLAETGIDLNGDGNLWDLYMTTSTNENGGVSAQYSYLIWYLQDAYQQEAGWVNILAGVRYALMHYVVPDGTGAPSNPLNCPLTQITRGWEVCSTDYVPVEFRHLDYKLLMT